MPGRVDDGDMDDLHEVSGYIENRRQILRSDAPVPNEPPLSREARDAILEFIAAREAGGAKILTVRKYYAWLPQLAARLGPDFLHPTRETGRKFDLAYPLQPLGRRKSGHYSQFSREGAWRVGTAFWRYQCDKADEDPPRWFSKQFSKKGYHRLDPKELLTREDVAKIAENCHNLRDKALVWMLWGLARRPQEILSLRVGDVEVLPERYSRVFIGGKKESPDAALPVHDDAHVAVVKWLNDHPRRNDPHAPLWIDTRTGGHGQVLSYRAVFKLVETAAKRAEITKPAFLYAFRHAGGMEKARNPGLSESIFEKSMGWAPGSRAKAAYLNVTGRDVEDAENALRGIVPSTGRGRPPPAPRICAACRLPNPAGTKFCSNCGLPLTGDAVGELEETRELMARIARVLKRPSVAKVVAEALADTP